MKTKLQLYKNAIGASNKQDTQKRKAVLDGYSTPDIAVVEILKREKFNDIWEPAAGLHAIVKVLKLHGHQVFTSDIKRWHKNTKMKRSFLNFTKLPKQCQSILTNPPFIYANEFVEHAMTLLKKGGKLGLLLRLQFLESKKRKLMFEKYPPIRIWVFSYRLPRMHRFAYEGPKSSSMVAFAWFIWQKGYQGDTVIKWI